MGFSLKVTSRILKRVDFVGLLVVGKSDGRVYSFAYLWSTYGSTFKFLGP